MLVHVVNANYVDGYRIEVTMGEKVLLILLTL
jgi:hypothetical protein